MNMYYERPMSCNNCLEYGHTLKKCHNTVETCGKCNNTGHMKLNCTKADSKCHPCNENNLSFPRNCRLFKFETEVNEIQIIERISKAQAKQKLHK